MATQYPPPIKRKRHHKRQRRLMMLFGALALMVVFLWTALHPEAKSAWLETPPSFYRPQFISGLSTSEMGLRPLPLGHEDLSLKQKLLAEIGRYPSVFKPHLFYYNLQDASFIDLKGEDSVAAASVIKLPVLLEYFRQIDQGAITPFTHLMYESFEQAAGSGMLQYRPPGQPLLAQDIARTMIQVSDNTCTNILIYQFGGAIGMNRIFDEFGLRGTHIGNWLPDLGGTNVITMRDMTTILYNIKQTDFLSPQSREAALQILEGTHNRRLLPALLPPRTLIAHKTGDIGTALGNAGLIMLPNGQNYIVAVQVDRPFNDYTAKTMIQNLSRIIYDNVKDRAALASASVSPDIRAN